MIRLSLVSLVLLAPSSRSHINFSTIFFHFSSLLPYIHIYTVSPSTAPFSTSQPPSPCLTIKTLQLFHLKVLFPFPFSTAYIALSFLCWSYSYHSVILSINSVLEVSLYSLYRTYYTGYTFPLLQSNCIHSFCAHTNIT